MTFYEAALQILARVGKPLTYQEITKLSLEDGLLSHIGKAPEMTMLARLRAVAKRMHDKPIMVTARDTFALTEWMLQEDADALAFLDTPLLSNAEKVLALRPLERHPQASEDNVRFIGKSLERKRREEGEGRRRRFPPISEVGFELLSDAGRAMMAEELLREAKARELAGGDCELSTLLAALAEDNQRRIDAGRRPQFQCQEAANGKWELQLDAQGLGFSEIQEGFARALSAYEGGGRGGAMKSTMGQRVSRQKVEEQQNSLRAWARDERKSMWRFLRSYLAELETRIFERAMLKLLGAERFREIKIAKRSKEAVLLTARRREGSLDIRYSIRLLSGATAIERKHIQALRGDLHHHHATLGMLCSAGDLRGEARSEALQNGEPPIMLWCGDALAEKFLEMGLGVQKHVIEFFELDEAFFEKLQDEVAAMYAKREARLRERQYNEAAFSTGSAGDSTEATWAQEEQPGEVEEEATVVRRRRNRRRRRTRRALPEEAGVEAGTPGGGGTEEGKWGGDSEGQEARVPEDTRPSTPTTEEA
ncbi:MAG: HTH domain-containing protein [Proteobacteria bacterium]|nr:HTH domain-containing protein [Cystobacterineae bacterium]MCL2259430.1 HTH domain-containing protein [Cystobacterineae bacterium]MCL2315314.1 HTH domain-containing protein [Pseudomonadota bacterium]